MQGRLQDLIELAREPSSARRRELLRGLTDVFFAGPSPMGGEMAMFDSVLTQLSSEMEEAVKAELSTRMASAHTPPAGLMHNLALDASMAVAGPVLSAGVLPEATLMKLAQTGAQDRLQALSKRAEVSESLSAAIVKRGDDETVGVLLRNQGAQLSRETNEAVVERAVANPALHSAVIDRHDLPVDLLNEMYFVVEAQLRDRILSRNAALDPAELEQALEIGRKAVASRDGALPADYAEAEAAVRAMRKNGQIGPSSLAAMLRNRQTTRFLIALAEMTDIDFHAARRILEAKELDALAIVCRAADFDRPLFTTFAVLILDNDRDAINKAKAYGEMYNELPRESALRTIRFWRMRRRAGDVAVAA